VNDRNAFIVSKQSKRLFKEKSTVTQVMTDRYVLSAKHIGYYFMCLLSSIHNGLYLRRFTNYRLCLTTTIRRQ